MGTSTSSPLAPEKSERCQKPSHVLPANARVHAPPLQSLGLSQAVQQMTGYKYSKYDVTEYEYVLFLLWSDQTNLKSCQIRSELLSHLAILFGCLNSNSNMWPPCGFCGKIHLHYSKLSKQWNLSCALARQDSLAGPQQSISDLLHPSTVHVHRLSILFVLQQKYTCTVHHSFPDCLYVYDLWYYMLHRSFGSSYWYLDYLVSKEICKSPVAAAAPKGITWQVTSSAPK